jgi:hypothetical protein
MAITLRRQPDVKKPIVKVKSAPTIKKMYTLPTRPIEPSHDLGDYSWLIYGQKKIGKSTLASLFPEAIFFMFEPGAKALRIYRVDCGTWEDALGYLTSIEKQKEEGTLKYKTAIIDTGFELYQKAFIWGCKELKIDYPREDNFGKDWTFIKNAVRDFHARIFNLGLGVVVLCHEGVKEQQTYTGSKYDQVIPLLPKPCDEYYRAVIDNVCWYHYRGKERFLQIRGTDHAMAGIALQADEYFKTPKGEQVFSIPIPSEPKKGMQVIVSAFNNKQTQTFKEETEKLSEINVKKSVAEKLVKAARKRGR